jgi:hypothetical protein
LRCCSRESGEIMTSSASRTKDLRIVLLQRSSDAGGSVGVIPITVLAHKNEFVTTGCELAQYQPTAAHLDDKFWAQISNFRSSFSLPMLPPIFR